MPTPTPTPSPPPREPPIPRTGRRDDDIESAMNVESGRGFVDEVIITHTVKLLADPI
jgi:hypothetical protein